MSLLGSGWSSIMLDMVSWLLGPSICNVLVKIWPPLLDRPTI